MVSYVALTETILARAGRMIFGVFSAFAEFERDLILEQTIASFVTARVCGRKDGRN